MSTDANKILYFDPNSINFSKNPGDNLSAIFKGIDIMKDPEEYSIAVDLEVEIKDRNNVIIGQKTIATNNGKSKTSNFLEGKNIGGTNVLTTYFTDITNKNTGDDYDDEALSISSIDIEFTSWYVASVIIKFTDVRGAGMFSNAASNDASKNGPNKGQNQFSPFFTMPYPIFNLKVKGFYGDAVSYPLHCTDFQAEFNNDKGNFDITAHFIGYTYAMLSDVQMSYLIAAPYLSKYGKDYWDRESIIGGRFRTLEGSPLPKIPELMYKVASGMLKQDKLDNTNPNIAELKKLNAEIDDITAMESNLKAYSSLLTSKAYGFKNNTTTPFLLELEITPGDTFNPDDINIKSSLATLAKSLKTNNIDLTTGENDFSKIIVIDKKNTAKYSVDFTKIYAYIDIKKLNNNNLKTELSAQIAQTKAETLTSSYGMVPTIYNLNKVLCAHLETLMYSIGACARAAGSQDRGTHVNGTDLKDDKLLAFPWITDVNGIDKYIGDLDAYPSFDEPQFVTSFIEAKTEVSKELEKIKNIKNEPDITSAASANGEFWYPLCSLDNSIGLFGAAAGKKSPYSYIGSLNGDGINNFKLLLSLRAMMAINLGADPSIGNDIQTLALSDVENMSLVFTSSSDIDLLLSATSDVLNQILKGGTLDSKISNYYPIKNNTTLVNGVIIDYNLNFKAGSATTNRNSIPLFSGTLKDYTYNPSGDYFYNGTLFDPNKRMNQVAIKICDGTENVRNVEKIIVGGVKNTNNSDLKGLISTSKYDVTRDSSSLFIRKEIYQTTDIKDAKSQIVNRMVGKSIKITDKTNVTDTQTVNAYISNFFTSQMNDVKYGFPGTMENNRTVYTGFTSETAIDSIDTNLSYPVVGGSEYYTAKNKHTFCLFGHPAYYSQEDHIGQNSANEKKAWMFLQTLPLDSDLIESTLLAFNTKKASKTFSMPKAALLLAGSMLWRIKNKVRLNKSVDKTFLLTNTVDCDKYIKPINSAHIGPILYSIKAAGSFDVSSFSGDINENIYKKSTFSKNVDGDISLAFTNTVFTDYLIKYFLDWANSSNKNDDSWYSIRNSLELHYSDGSRIFSADFISIINNVTSSETKQIAYDKLRNDIKQFSDGTYGTNFSYNIDKDVNVNSNEILLFNSENSLGSKAIMKLLLTESLVGTLTGGWSSTGLTTSIFTKYFNSIKTGLNAKKKISSSTSSTQGTASIDAYKVDDNVDIKLQTYKALKILYDKWVSSFNFDTIDSQYKWIEPDQNKKSVVNGYLTYDIKNFKFIDRSYNNIGSSFIIDYDYALNNSINSGDQRSLYSSITDILSRNQFLFLPMPNYQSWDTANDFAKIFRPLSYSESSISVSGGTGTSIFICMFAGNPSKSLNFGDVTYQYKDDALNFRDGDKIEPDFIQPQVSLTADEIEAKAVIDPKMKNVPVFEVNYGKQNQSYFKNITLNMNNPNITDTVIQSLKNINERANNKSSLAPIGQDLYTIYSQYSYTCQVDMLGCAQIQPMMYFQLNNIPMWNGAYLIYKVNHSIRPGNMTTSFVGMRMGKNYAKFVDPKGISYDSIGNMISGSDISQVDKTKKISDQDLASMLDKKIGTSPFTFRQYITKNAKVKGKFEFTYGKNTQDYVSVGIDSRIKTLSVTVDSIYATWSASPNYKKYGNFHINSGYRTKENNDSAGGSDSSAHVQGLAVDLQLEKTSKEGQKALFEHIKERMRLGLHMDQLLLEGSNLGSGGWCHVSPANANNNVVQIRGEVYETDENGKNKTNYEIIPQAKGTGRIIDSSAVLEQFLKYWTNAEAQKIPAHHWVDGVWNSYLDNGDDASRGKYVPTLAYGLQLPSSTKQFQDAVGFNPNNPDAYTKSYTCSDEQAMQELRVRVQKTMPAVNKRLGSSAKTIVMRYKYAIAGLILNGYSKKSLDVKWNNFIQSIISYGSTEANVDKIFNNIIMMNPPERTTSFGKFIKGTI